ncbi:FHA domain-containing protein [Infirmifilum lucidum]|uniref:FHA domain-containing protein n=1 Tax=Infirmifilum lucidum TaxID=2776706 RepID=A0A7L9FFS1_9CREN|nr:FHA domain-containing protein [Infirmifilum lucidum]QOJ78640.1 FHA domain-containing protein [Infirmifilum lucidum]
MVRIRLFKKQKLSLLYPETSVFSASGFLILEGFGVQFTLPSNGYLIIGRNPENNKVALFDGGGSLVFEFPVKDTYVTRYSPLRGKFGHAKITCRDGECFWEDLNPTNPTLVNGNKIRAGEPYPLKEGDVIEVGYTRLRYERPFPMVEETISEGTVAREETQIREGATSPTVSLEELNLQSIEGEKSNSKE